jgi:hypothetical protein
MIFYIVGGMISVVVVLLIVEEAHFKGMQKGWDLHERGVPRPSVPTESYFDTDFD